MRHVIDRYTTTDRRKLAAMQTDHKANLPPRQLTAKARAVVVID